MGPDLQDVLTLLPDVEAAVREVLSAVPLAPTRVTRPHDPVTDVDLLVDRRLRELLPKLVRADYLSEESPLLATAASRWLWVVDPIDGTHNFVAGGVDFGVAVALMEQKSMTTLLACCHYPATGLTFTAARGHGAFVDGEPLSAGSSALGPLLAYGVPQEAYADVERVGRLVAGLMRRGFVLRQSGSAMHDICRVAAGQLHGFVEEGIRLWDFVAADLIATEVGAKSWSRPSNWFGAADGAYDYVVAWTDDLTPLVDIVGGRRGRCA